jgi:small subunit ribosomal protein S6
MRTRHDGQSIRRFVMNIYENIVILNAALGDEEIESAITKIRDLIANSGGEVLKADMWGRRKLAYEIKKHKKGFYVLFLFRSPSSFIKKLEDFYKVFDPVVRFLVIKLEKKRLAAVVLPKPEEASAPPSHKAGGQPEVPDRPIADAE